MGSFSSRSRLIASTTARGLRKLSVQRMVTASGAYVRQTTGSLCVTIRPAGAVTAGARWRRVGSTAWLASGIVESGVPTGAGQVEFKPVPGWKTPRAISVTIVTGQTAQASRTYQDNRSGVRAQDWTSY